MNAAETQRQRVREMLASGHVASWTDIRGMGVSRRALLGMLDTGELTRASHNLYRLADAPARRFSHWDEIAAKYGQFVVCLLSAAQYHGLTTYMPQRTWVALPQGARPADPSLRAVQWPREGADGRPHRFWESGIDVIEADGALYRVTGAARTVVDLCRWRSRLPDGERVFLEALGAYDQSGRSRAGLRAIAREFGAAGEISGLLRARSEFTNTF